MNRKQKIQTALFSLVTTSMVFASIAYACHATLHVGSDCEKANADLEIVPNTDVKTATINGQNTRQLTVPFNENKDDIAFNGYVKWFSGFQWSDFN